MSGNLVVRGACDADGRSVEVAIQGGQVVGREPGLPIFDGTGLAVLPGLIDLQVNGAAGVDLTAEPERLWEVAAALPRYGVTAFLPTIISTDASTRVRALAALRSEPPEGQTFATPLGLHFEGPFLASSHRGAHPQEMLVDPVGEAAEGWSRDRGVRMVTIAPELPGAIELISSLTQRGVVVSVGHTGATGGEVRAALAAGARCVTHLFNAMPAPTAREPGPVGVALDDATVVAGLVVDGHHLAPELVRLAWRCLGPERFLTVSDTTAALGLSEGRTRLGAQEVVVCGGAVRLTDGTLAGSAASLPAGLALLHQIVGCSRAEAAATATATPAALIGDETGGHLRPGARGDLVLVSPGTFDVVATVIGGRVAVDRR